MNVLPVLPPGRTLTVAGQVIELFHCDRLDANLMRSVCADRSERGDALRINDNTGMLANDHGHKHGTTDLPLAVCRGCPVGRAHRGLPPLQAPRATRPTNGHNGHDHDEDGEEQVAPVEGEAYERDMRDRMAVRDSFRAELTKTRPKRMRGQRGLGRPRTLLEHPGDPHDGGAKSDTFAGWARRLDVAEMTLRQRKKRGLPMAQILSPVRLPNPTTSDAAFTHVTDDDGGKRALEAAGYRVQTMRPAASMPGSWMLLVTAANALKPTKADITAILSNAGIAVHHVVMSAKGMTVTCMNSRLARQRTDTLVLAKLWATGSDIEERLRAAVYDLMRIERDGDV